VPVGQVSRLGERGLHHLRPRGVSACARDVCLCLRVSVSARLRLCVFLSPCRTVALSLHHSVSACVPIGVSVCLRFSPYRCLCLRPCVATVSLHSWWT
jgi:hypothetical protein